MEEVAFAGASQAASDPGTDAYMEPRLDQKDCAGVFPAITTPFQADLSVDYDTFGAQARWLIECGCHGIVVLGSLGEAPILTREEKIEILKHAKRSLSDKAPVIAGISGLSTVEAVWLAKEAHRAGADGLMVLPPHRGDWRETQPHVSAVFEGNAAFLHALQQSHCVWNGYHSGADDGTARAA
jgi:dihydrodipicolinate synthase/N-acetylneuraminate lyase